MVYFFFLLPNQGGGERPPFIEKERPLFLVNFQYEITFHKGRNLINFQILRVYNEAIRMCIGVSHISTPT